jgi:hypothetical protein
MRIECEARSWLAYPLRWAWESLSRRAEFPAEISVARLAHCSRVVAGFALPAPFSPLEHWLSACRTGVIRPFAGISSREGQQTGQSQQSLAA